MKIIQLSVLVLVVLLTPVTQVRADLFAWSNTEVQYLHGDGYRQPVNPRDISQSIITVTHAHGWALGRNFFFMDTLFTEAGQPSQTNVYGEAYSYLSLSKITGHDLSYGIFKDLNATVGVNAGENFDSPKSGARIALYGFTVDFNLPGFKLFNVDVLQHQVLEPTETGSSWQVTPVWRAPFKLAGLSWSFEGFADFIDSKNPNYTFNILAQPQLRLDVGELMGQSGHLFVGLEYQYWYHKYGLKNLNESLPQALVAWKF
ncbi:MAG: DUF5020 family protein [Methylovulum sp.]|jgi:nucleoside-specific outer membrane channel protein Tsx|nr:DUF5020 family protein [Methylovulum sp.]